MRPQVVEIIRSLPPGAVIADVGCAGFAVKIGTEALGRSDLRHVGIDYGAPETIPDGVDFRLADLNCEPLPAADDSFDLIVAAHVIEHMADPIRFFGEIVRVLKPGGIAYIEAPSERAAMLPGMWFRMDDSRSLSFWDDPTHTGRPWPPQALYRLAKCFGCEPQVAGYHTSLGAKLKALIKVPLGLLMRNPAWVETGICNFVGWASYAVIRKPFSGPGTFRYFMR